MLEVRDEVLGITTSDLVVVSGDPATTLAPDGVLVLAYETRAGQDLVRTDTEVTMVPVDEGGVPLGDEVSGSARVEVRVADDDRPGFAGVLAGSWGVLAWIGRALVLVLAAVLPFAWVPIVVWAVWRWRRRPRPVA